MNKFINPDYKKFYELYKKMPAISSASILIAAILWSFVDTFVNQVDVGMYSTIYRYGILQTDSPIINILIWWIVGAVLAVVTWFFSALAVSATIIRTDEVLAISNKICENNADSKLNAPTVNVPKVILPKEELAADQKRCWACGTVQKASNHYCINCNEQI
jgi:hypothetical protein